MNILRIVTLNKHGDFEEVLFSSILSYILDPRQDHGLKSRFLELIVREVFPDIDQVSLDTAEVVPERLLGNTGKVDLLITLGDRILAIEVKIWDRSARNISSSNEHQVERYCQHLSEEFMNRDWKFIFLVPTTASRTCINEFKKVCDGKLGNKVKLMTWNPGDQVNESYGLSESSIIQKSILDIISDLMHNISRVELPLNTQWLLDSLIDIIPDLVEEIPEPGRFPNREHLIELPTWLIFNTIFTVGKRWPISLHTTVGIPYGWANQRSTLHGNSLYRIRTVTDYYTEVADRDNHLPINAVEIELWPDVYEASKESIHDWLKEIGLGKKALRFDYHLDSGKNESMMVVSIGKNVHIDEDNIERFNHILKEGFRNIAQ